MVEDSALDKYIKPRVSVLWYINIKRVLHYQLLENALGKTNLMSVQIIKMQFQSQNDIRILRRYLYSIMLYLVNNVKPVYFSIALCIHSAN